MEIVNKEISHEIGSGKEYDYDTKIGTNYVAE
jgi:hypothetical protein